MVEFKAKISNQGEDKVVIVPNCYREDFPHRSIVRVKLQENEPNKRNAN